MHQLRTACLRYYRKRVLPNFAVLFFSILLLAIVWGAACWQIESDRQATIANVMNDNGKFSRAFEEHVSRIIKTNEQYLNLLKQEYEESEKITPSIRRLLDQLSHDSIFLQMGIYGADGEVLVSRIPFPEDTNMADVPHLQAHRTADTGQLYIGKPYVGRISKQSSIHMSRRLNHADGSFAGAAVIAIDPGYFTKFYQDMDFNKYYVVRVVGMDGIVRASNISAEVGINVASRSLFSELERNSVGFYRSTGSNLGKVVLTSYRKMNDYPFILQIGLDEAALTPLAQRRYGYIGAAVAVSLFIILYSQRLVRSSSRLRRNEERLKESFDELFSSHEELAATHEELAATEDELRNQYNALLLMNEQVSRQNTILSLLQETAFSLVNKLDMDQLLNTIVVRATAMVGARDAFLVLPSLDGNYLEVKAGIGIYAEEKVIRIPVNAGLMGKVFASGQAETVADYSIWEGRTNLPHAEEICSIFAAPLYAKSHVAGVFGVVFRERGHQLESDQISLLERFCELASLALENAALHSQLQRELEERIKSETTLSEILNVTDEAVIINEPDSGGILWTNPRTTEMFGYSELELKQLGAVAISTPAHFEAAKTAMRKAVCEGSQCYERETTDKFGRKIIVEVHTKRAIIDGRVLCLTTMRDITRRKEMVIELAQMQAEKQAVLDAIPDAMFIVDLGGHILSFHRPHAAFGEFIEPDRDVTAWNIIELLPYDVAQTCLDYVQQAIDTNTIQGQEYTVTVHGTVRYWDVRFSKVGQTTALVMVRDVTEIRNSQMQVEFLSLHDPMTEVYNRTYFEAEMAKPPRSGNGGAAILVCDVDGLKLINDTLGHRAGDDLLKVVTGILRSVFSVQDMVARIGGDEFAVIIYRPDRINMEQIVEQIRQQIATYNADNPHLPVSLSIGWASGYAEGYQLEELFKQADNAMYRQKMHQSQSMRSAIVETMMQALEARDYITEGHADRLQYLVEELGRRLRLTESRLADLRLLAKFHDIGKVGIPDSILNKPGKLTDAEREIMHRHCEIGCRIALASPDLAPISDWILKHQEWWNGNGYPLGIKETQIPLECRILALADAYDAMTNDRPYREALSLAAALSEIERCAGSQFDPELASLFITMLREA